MGVGGDSDETNVSWIPFTRSSYALRGVDEISKERRTDSETLPVEPPEKRSL